MTAQLSRERLEALANLQSLECMALPASHAESAQMARMLLAGMDSEPVYQLSESWNGQPLSGWKDCTKEEFDAAIPCGCERMRRVLYAAPPAPVYERAAQQMIANVIADLGLPKGAPFVDVSNAIHALKQAAPPVAVPDVDPRDAFEAVFPIPKYAERCGAGYCCTAYSAWGAQDFIQKWNGWNACRDAMLKAGPVTGWIKCGERMPEQKQSNRYIGLNLLLNERTVVQGGFDDGSFWLDGVRIDNVTRWMPLPAAPEQEV